MKTGRELMREIKFSKVSRGRLRFWWLGQHSFVVRTANFVIWLDPFLSPHSDRLMQPPLSPSETTGASLITGSHDHGDHIDRDALPDMMEANHRCLFVLPRAVWERSPIPGVDSSRVRTMDDDETLTEGGITVTALRASHEFFDRDERYGYPYLAYVIEADGVVLLHPGDTCMYDGLITRLKDWEFTVAFLPVNGRDGTRLRAGFIGNMTWQEAADLAGAIRPRLTVPSHYGMFAVNSGDPAPFADYLEVKYPDLPYRICKCGEAVDVD